MVFQENSENVTLQRKSSMATAPVKSQPLHNFSFPLLKWGKNNMNNNRSRKLVDASRESPALDHRSSASEAESDGGSLSKKVLEPENRKSSIGSHSVKNRFSVSHCSSTPVAEKSKKNQAVSEGKTLVEEARSKLLINLPSGNKDERHEPVSKKKSSVVAANDVGGGETEELVTKPWNLRPRRAVIKNPNVNGGAQENLSCTTQPSENLPKSIRLRGFAEAPDAEKKEKRKFSISLSRNEIEEDFFVLTGSKLSRRPKKRAKNIQRQLDNIFPGLWLAEITADSYRIPDAPAKRNI